MKPALALSAIFTPPGSHSHSFASALSHYPSRYINRECYSGSGNYTILDALNSVTTSNQICQSHLGRILVPCVHRDHPELQIQRLACGEISPDFIDTNNGFNTWVRNEVGWLCAIEVYNAEIPLLAAFAYPLASCQELRAVVNYMASSFMLEEMTDRCSSTKARTRTQLWLSTLSQCDKGRSSNHPFIKAMRSELVPNIKTAVDPFHWPQFIDSNVKYAENMIQEAVDRESHLKKDIICDIQSYMMTRRESIGTRPCFVLLRSTRHLYIPDDVLANPTVKEMEDVALDMVYIANDVYSFKKEYADNGAPNNLLTIIQKDPITEHMDLQERLDYAEKLFTRALSRFNDCKKKLPSISGDLDKQLAGYADGMIDWIAGNVQWSGVNHRYNVFSNDADRKNYIMRMDPDGGGQKLQWSLLFVFAALIALFMYSFIFL